MNSQEASGTGPSSILGVSGMALDSTATTPMTRFQLEMEFGLKNGHDTDNSNNDDDDDSYDEQQELADLVAASAQSRRRQTESPAQASHQARARSGMMEMPPSILRNLFGGTTVSTRKPLRLLIAMAVVFAVFYFLMPSSKKREKYDSLQQSKAVLYKCPKKRVKTNPDAVLDYYHSNMTAIMSAGVDVVNLNLDLMKSDSDLDTFTKTFRERPYDNWGHTYNEVKASMVGWKSETFAPFIGLNASIYDVTLGIGLDLLMTLEILKENNGLFGITVYGNDIPANSPAVALRLLENVFQRDTLSGAAAAGVEGNMGVFCQADSTLLHEFVPADTFDVVFSGRILPLANPLQKKGKQQGDLDRQYAALCGPKPNKRQKMDLELYHKSQQDWYLRWTQEMLRIVKPGAPVILEHVSLPLCQSPFDFGGVDPTFWNHSAPPALTNLIMPYSVKIKPDRLVKERYHVSMRKKKKPEQ